jgi:hypothetical protein
MCVGNISSSWKDSILRKKGFCVVIVVVVVLLVLVLLDPKGSLFGAIIAKLVESGGWAVDKRVIEQPGSAIYIYLFLFERRNVVGTTLESTWRFGAAVVVMGESQEIER